MQDDLLVLGENESMRAADLTDLTGASLPTVDYLYVSDAIPVVDGGDELYVHLDVTETLSDMGTTTVQMFLVSTASSTDPVSVVTEMLIGTATYHWQSPAFPSSGFFQGVVYEPIPIPRRGMQGRLMFVIFFKGDGMDAGRITLRLAPREDQGKRPFPNGI